MPSQNQANIDKKNLLKALGGDEAIGKETIFSDALSFAFAIDEQDVSSKDLAGLLAALPQPLASQGAKFEALKAGLEQVVMAFAQVMKVLPNSEARLADFKSQLPTLLGAAPELQKVCADAIDWVTSSGLTREKSAGASGVKGATSGGLRQAQALTPPVLLEAGAQSPVGGTPHVAEAKPLTKDQRKAICAELGKKIEGADTYADLSPIVADFCKSLKPGSLDDALIKDLFHEICRSPRQPDSTYPHPISRALAGMVDGMGGAGMNRNKADLLVTLLRSDAIDSHDRMRVVERIAGLTFQVGGRCPLHQAIEGRRSGGLYQINFLGWRHSKELGAARKHYVETFSNLNGIRQQATRLLIDANIKGGAGPSLGLHWSGLLKGEPKTEMEIREETQKLVADLLQKDPKPGPYDIMQAAINQFIDGDRELAKSDKGQNRLAMTVKAMTAGLSDELGFDTVAAYAVQAAVGVPGGNVGYTPRWLSATFAGLGSVSPDEGDAAKRAGGESAKAQPGKTQSTMAYERPAQWAERRNESIAAPRLKAIETAFTLGRSYRTSGARARTGQPER